MIQLYYPKLTHPKNRRIPQWLLAFSAVDWDRAVVCLACEAHSDRTQGREGMDFYR